MKDDNDEQIDVYVKIRTVILGNNKVKYFLNKESQRKIPKVRANFKSSLFKVKSLGDEMNSGLTRIERAINRSTTRDRDKDRNVNITLDKITKKANFKEIVSKKWESSNKLCSIPNLSIMSTESSQKKYCEECLNTHNRERENNICMVNITEENINTITEMSEKKET
jgi:hypothetical protein